MIASSLNGNDGGVRGKVAQREAESARNEYM